VSEALSLHSFPEAPILEALLDVEQSVLDALPIGIYGCDAEGRILRVNRKAILLWGRGPRLLDLAQRFCGSFRLENFDGQVIPPDQSPVAHALRDGEIIEGAEAVVQNPDGKRWVARVNVKPLRDPNGVIVGAINCFQDVTQEHEMRAALERQQRTFDLAMVASRMGTWRYTFADNICIYDDNAQRLYGLTEARFLHDEAGVQEKFHPGDIPLMWARVKKALDPAGDGRYEVEYRVKQLDGSWRWLSAWGLVEFDGSTPDRKPVPIAGASRDLTELKRAEELQRLLINELNHRVKNTLATVQSIAVQTLRGADDLRSARTALVARIISLARAHDLLTERSWSGAELREVVAGAMEPFAVARIDCAGDALEISPKHALALSLALHELATNAAKYGALSSPNGRVELRWHADAGMLHVTWRESGGPAVTPPTRRGFGSRLIEDGLLCDLGGDTRLDYAADGVRCEISALL
jgi:two-component sensor histidine kinase/PAS domain-containing protein